MKKTTFAIYLRSGLCLELYREIWLWSVPTHWTWLAGPCPMSNAGRAPVFIWSRRWYLVERLGLTSMDQSNQSASIFMDMAPTAELHGCNAPNAVRRCSWFVSFALPDILLCAEIPWKSLKYFFISTCSHLHDDSRQIIKIAAQTLLSGKAPQLPLRVIQTPGLSSWEPGRLRVIWKR